MNTTCERHIQITKRYHRGEWRIFFGYDYNAEWNSLIRKISGAKYSITYKRWHIPYSAAQWNEFLALGLPYILPAATTGTAVQPRALSDNDGIGLSSHEGSPTTPHLPDGGHQEEAGDIQAGAAHSSTWTHGEVSIKSWKQNWEVCTPYSKEIVSGLKAIKGSWYRSATKSWFVPKRIDNADAIQKLFKIWAPQELQAIKAELGANDNNSLLALYHHPAFPQQVCVRIEASLPMVELVKSIPGRSYHPDMKAWTLSDAHADRLMEKAGQMRVRVEDSRKKQPTTKELKPEAHNKAQYERMKAKYSALWNKGMDEFIAGLTRQRYSWNTVRNYAMSFAAFLSHHTGMHAGELDLPKVNAWLEHLALSEKSDSVLHNSINAIKFYYEKVMHWDSIDVNKIKRPRKRKQLPKVISIQEMDRLLAALHNIKHVCILYVLYDSGLRLGEVLNLQLEDLLWDRNQIFVKGGKGKKDRYTLLSESQKGIINLYLSEYRPKYWLFEGVDGVSQYSSRSVELVVKKAATKAGILKRVTPHILRHCFATHLMDSGVQLPYIQQLLGHSELKTTMIYLETSAKGYGNIISPLDMIRKRKFD
jgi:integrase/recombinase XerD